MANIYKNEKKSLTNTDLTTLYTVPGNSRAIVKSILAAEDAAGSAVVKVTLVDSSSNILWWTTKLVYLLMKKNKF